MKPVLRFEPGDPVWIPQFGRDIRAHVDGYRTVSTVTVQMNSGKKATVKAADVRYRYEKGEY